MPNTSIYTIMKRLTEEYDPTRFTQSEPFFSAFVLDDDYDPYEGATLGWGWICTEHTEETKRKISESQKGKKHTEETKRKLREMNMGKKNPNYGNKWTEEYTRKMRILHKGEGNPNYGNTYSEETKRLLSIKAKNRERGTCRYCDKEMDISNLGRWHNDKCKYK